MKGKIVEDLIPTHRSLIRHSVPNATPKAIRNITVGSVISRVTPIEEAQVMDGSDSVAKVIIGRINGYRYADLDNIELQEGLGYLVNFWKSAAPIPADYDAAARLDLLLADGTRAEKYTGAL